MIQIVSLVGEITGVTGDGEKIVNVHTHYVTERDVVVNDAFVVVSPSKYTTGPAFESLSNGNLVLVHGRFLSNDFGGPLIIDNEAVFKLEADQIQLLAHEADPKRGSDHFQIVMVGNLGKDGEVRYTATGKELQVSSMATNHLENGQTDTTWFKLASWINSKLGSSPKGTRAFVQGVPRFDPETGGPLVWQTQAGENRSNYEINVRRYIPFVKIEDSSPYPNYDEPEDIPF